MLVRQAVLVLVSVVGLSGCASYALSGGDYDSVAHRWAAIHRCSESGRMDASTAATGQQLIRQRLSNSTYDKDLLDQSMKKFSSTKFTDEACRSAAVAVLGWEKQRNQQQQDTKEMNEAIRAATPKQTYCNKIGNQVFCNTY